MFSSPSAFGTGFDRARREGAAAPVATAAKALRRKSRRPFLASSTTARMSALDKKFSGALIKRPESNSSCITQSPVLLAWFYPECFHAFDSGAHGAINRTISHLLSKHICMYKYITQTFIPSTGFTLRICKLSRFFAVFATRGHKGIVASLARHSKAIKTTSIYIKTGCSPRFICASSY